MDVSQTISQDTRASIWFLEEKELYATVKPYSLAFTPAVEMPRENIERKEVSVNIFDIRGSDKEFSLEKNGFMILPFQGECANIDWDNEKCVKDIHYPRVISEIKNAFPGAECIPLSSKVSQKRASVPTHSNLLTNLILKVRKRHSAFPKSTGQDYTYGQPLRAAHVGTTQSLQNSISCLHLAQI